MGGEFQPVTLGSACTKIGSGATPRGGKEAYLGGNTSLIRSQNVYNDRFAKNGLVYISDAQAAELGNVVVEHEDVLLNITGDSVARCCIVDSSVLPARVNQHVAIIRPNKNILNAKFLRYALVSPKMQDHLFSLASAGATRDALTKAMVEGLRIEAPSLPIQKRIAHILGTLDDKIELNRRTNETLEAMARAIFKSWFVDFDPVKAKAEGKKPFRMDDETAALFPSEFEDSELGPIPKGWRVGTFSEICTVLSGTTPSTSIQEFWHPLEHAWSSPKDLSNIEGLFLLQTERKISSAGLAQIGSGLLPKGSVLLSTRAPIGYVAIANIPVAINQGYAGLVVHDSGSRFYVENWIRSNHEILVSNANGSTFLEISKGTLKLLPCLKPSVQVLRAFGKLLEPFYDALLGNQVQSKTLAQTRDLLLPKLLTGEIEVGEK